MMRNRAGAGQYRCPISGFRIPAFSAAVVRVGKPRPLVNRLPLVESLNEASGGCGSFTYPENIFTPQSKPLARPPQLPQTVTTPLRGTMRLTEHLTCRPRNKSLHPSKANSAPCPTTSSITSHDTLKPAIGIDHRLAGRMAVARLAEEPSQPGNASRPPVFPYLTFDAAGALN